MADLLIRGLRKSYRLQLERLAKSRNLSINQMTLEVLMEALKNTATKEERLERHREAEKRIDAFREAYYKKYGLHEDSTKIIREMRDNR